MKYVLIGMNYLTTKETAEKLGVSAGRVRQMVLAGQLHAEKFGRELMISETDIQAVRNRKTGRPKKTENGKGETKSSNNLRKSFADVASEFIGSIKSGLPTDLSSNKDYLKDLGKKSAEKEVLQTKRPKEYLKNE
jgi:excisionase family DNA binding protein